jgi:hypothetical protein
LHLHDLTIVTPVKSPRHLDLFIKANEWLLNPNLVIVIDSGGGEQLREYCWRYLQKDVSLWEARKLGYSQVNTKITLNLDCDVVPTLEYVKEAYETLEEDKAEAVSIHFDPIHTGHLEFGVSMWKTEWLKKLYDYPPKPVEKLIKVGKQEWVVAFQSGFCECSYMWSKLLSHGGRLETLPYRAKHLKP